LAGGWVRFELSLSRPAGRHTSFPTPPAVQAPHVAQSSEHPNTSRLFAAPALECSDVRLGWQETRKRGERSELMDTPYSTAAARTSIRFGSPSQRNCTCGSGTSVSWPGVSWVLTTVARHFRRLSPRPATSASGQSRRSGPRASAAHVRCSPKATASHQHASRGRAGLVCSRTHQPA
jgi:hypothetical protein